MKFFIIKKKKKINMSMTWFLLAGMQIGLVNEI